MIFAVFLLSMLFGEQPRSPPAGTVETVYRVRPITEVEAAEEFGRTCMAAWPSFDRLETTLEASSRSYERAPDTMNGLRSNWRAEFGELAFVRAVPQRPELPLPQCNLAAFTRASVNEVALQDAITAMLSRQLLGPPAIAVSERSTTWSWDWLGRQVTLARIRVGPQQIELSLQGNPS